MSKKNKLEFLIMIKAAHYVNLSKTNKTDQIYQVCKIKEMNKI